MKAVTTIDLKKDFVDTLIEVLENGKKETDLLLPHQSPTIRQFINDKDLYPPKKEYQGTYSAEEALNIFWRILIANLKRKDRNNWGYVMSLLPPRELEDYWAKSSRKKLVNIMKVL